jgi:tyrosine-specific transport protein
MPKQIGSIMLVAGTCIGSGMIALPMLLIKIGIIPSIILMLLVWLLMYFSALITVELNLQAGKGLALEALAKKFSGLYAEIIGAISFKILSFALIAVYIYAGSSVIQKMFESYGFIYDFNYICFLYAFIIFVIFMFPIRFIDYINRILFISLLIVIAILIIGLISLINWSNLPLFTDNYQDLSYWGIILPVVFTSFGFQGSCHSFANYCNLNSLILKRALLWGSLIPMIVYIIWNFSAVAVIFNENPEFYYTMFNNKVEVGDFVAQLSKIAKWKSIQILIWWVSILAIITSVLGVGLGLFDSIKYSFTIKNRNFIAKIVASTITVLPSFLVAILVPNAFITVLGFSGMILAIIAILLPVYLLYKVEIKNFYYPILKNKILVIISVVFGLSIMICEISNIIFKY